MRPEAIALVALVALGCAGPQPGELPIPEGSMERFRSRVQPHLAERCASGGCHGRAERPLALFAAGAYRADPARTFLDEPLSEWEIEENARRISAFALEGPAIDSLAVQKPLALDEGGVWHDGGEVFPDARDAACLALTQWLDARTLPDAGVP